MKRIKRMYYRLDSLRLIWLRNRALGISQEGISRRGTPPTLCPGGDRHKLGSFQERDCSRRLLSPREEGELGRTRGQENETCQPTARVWISQNTGLHVNLYFSTSSHVSLNCLDFLSNHFNVPRQ